MAHRIRGIRPSAGIILTIGLLVAGGCGPKPIFRTGAQLPDSDSSPRVAAPAVRPPKSRVEELAQVWLGTPYQYGGTDERGIDCSALAQNVLGDLGRPVPRTTKAQRTVGRKIAIGEVLPGDLLFFRLESNRVNHVGIALGRDRFVHASSSRGVVVDRLMDDYFARRVVEARRVLADQ